MIPLTEQEQKLIIKAISLAEEKSSGEIRVHIDNGSKDESSSSLAKIALDVFHSFKMTETKDRNGVLFYLNFDQKYLTIIGDEGIHKHVSQQFWNKLHEEMTYLFRDGEIAKGIIHGIDRAGNELIRYFPEHDIPTNELPNDISFS